MIPALAIDPKMKVVRENTATTTTEIRVVRPKVLQKPTAIDCWHVWKGREWIRVA
jgi:hypothetical protein